MDTIGRYQIRGEWGRGGMGVVYRAYDPELDRDVAIQSLPLDGATPAQIAALAGQAQAVAQLRHPNVLVVHDFLKEDGDAFIVTEQTGGTSLEAMLAAGGARDRKEAFRILRETAMALDAAHSAGIVHRDLQPAAILLDESGQVKLTGFRLGLPAPQPDENLEASCYQSPEQLCGAPGDREADQFALAIVAFQLLTGASPFSGETWLEQSSQIINAPHTRLRDIDRKLPAALDDAISRALQKEPARRFPSCAAFVEALAAAAPQPKIPPKVIIGVIMVCSLLVLFMGYRAMSALVSTTPQPAPQAPAVVPPPAPAAAASTPAAPDSLSLILDGIPMDFAAIPAGRFVMGCNSCPDGAKPEHMVELPRPFQLGRTEVTEKHWNAVMTGKATGADLPKVQVSWNEAQQFLDKLNFRNDGFLYRLPTEAEWEYAARANDPGVRPRNLDDLAWTSKNSGGKLREPASAKLGNGWGLYDMLGNASEWTNDWFTMNYDQSSPPRNSKGLPTGATRVIRGGNGGAGPLLAGYAHRTGVEPGARGPWLGFRVARERK